MTIPTRGVIFAETVRTAILSPELPKDSHIFIIENKPIPDSHNECVRRALATDATHVLFIEDDMAIPAHAIEWMCAYAREGEQYMAVDYSPKVGAEHTNFIDQKKVWATGLGCTMISRKVFEQIGDPYFTDTIRVRIDSFHPFQYHKIQQKYEYGGFDIYFGIRCNELGIKIKHMEGLRAEHLRMKCLERIEKNDGQYTITRLT